MLQESTDLLESPFPLLGLLLLLLFLLLLFLLLILQEGNAQAVSLVLVRQAEAGQLPLKTLKEQTAEYVNTTGEK